MIINSVEDFKEAIPRFKTILAMLMHISEHLRPKAYLRSTVEAWALEKEYLKKDDKEEAEERFSHFKDGIEGEIDMTTLYAWLLSDAIMHSYTQSKQYADASLRMEKHYEVYKQVLELAIKWEKGKFNFEDIKNDFLTFLRLNYHDVMQNFERLIFPKFKDAHSIYSSIQNQSKAYNFMKGFMLPDLENSGGPVQELLQAPLEQLSLDKQFAMIREAALILEELGNRYSEDETEKLPEYWQIQNEIIDLGLRWTEKFHPAFIRPLGAQSTFAAMLKKINRADLIATFLTERIAEHQLAELSVGDQDKAEQQEKLNHNLKEIVRDIKERIEKLEKKKLEKDKLEKDKLEKDKLAREKLEKAKQTKQETEGIQKLGRERAETPDLERPSKSESGDMIEILSVCMDVLLKVKQEYGYEFTDFEPLRWMHGVNNIVRIYDHYKPKIGTRSRASKPRILWMGDSVSAGVGVLDAEKKKRWIQTVIERLKEYCEIVNCSIPGHTTFDGASFIAENIEYYKPDYVVYTGGGNNIFPKEFNQEIIDDMEKDMISFVKTCFAKGIKAVVWGLGVPATFLDYEKWRPALADLMQKVREDVLFINRRESFHVFPLPEDLLTEAHMLKEHMPSEKLHPNAEGQQELAEHSIMTLKKLLVEERLLGSLPTSALQARAQQDLEISDSLAVSSEPFPLQSREAFAAFLAAASPDSSSLQSRARTLSGTMESEFAGSEFSDSRSGLTSRSSSGSGFSIRSASGSGLSARSSSGLSAKFVSGSAPLPVYGLSARSLSGSHSSRNASPFRTPLSDTLSPLSEIMSRGSDSTPRSLAGSNSVSPAISGTNSVAPSPEKLSESAKKSPLPVIELPAPAGAVSESETASLLKPLPLTVTQSQPMSDVGRSLLRPPLLRPPVRSSSGEFFNKVRPESSKKIEKTDKKEKKEIMESRFKSDQQSSHLPKPEMRLPLNLQARSVGGQIASDLASKIADQSRPVIFSAFDLQNPSPIKKEQIRNIRNIRNIGKVDLDKPLQEKSTL